MVKVLGASKVASALTLESWGNQQDAFLGPGAHEPSHALLVVPPVLENLQQQACPTGEWSYDEATSENVCPRCPSSVLLPLPSFG